MISADHLPPRGGERARRGRAAAAAAAAARRGGGGYAAETPPPARVRPNRVAGPPRGRARARAAPCRVTGGARGTDARDEGTKRQHGDSSEAREEDGGEAQRGGARRARGDAREPGGPGVRLLHPRRARPRDRRARRRALLPPPRIRSTDRPTSAPTRLRRLHARRRAPRRWTSAPRWTAPTSSYPCTAPETTSRGNSAARWAWDRASARAPAAAASERRRRADSARMTTSAPSRATRRSSTGADARARAVSKSGAQIFSGPGAERPAPSVGPSRPALPPTDEERGISVEDRFGDGAPPLGGAPFDDDYEASGLRTRDTDASKKLDAVYQKNAARLAALGIDPSGGGGGGGVDPEDADQLESLLQNFLKVNRARTPAGDDEPPTLVEESSTILRRG